MTYMDVGNAMGLSGTIPAHAAAAYSTSFGIAAPLHPCSRGIQYILYIKKPPEKGAYM